jgi:hypothetical protein
MLGWKVVVVMSRTEKCHYHLFVFGQISFAAVKCNDDHYGVLIQGLTYAVTSTGALLWKLWKTIKARADRRVKEEGELIMWHRFHVIKMIIQFLILDSSSLNRRVSLRFSFFFAIIFRAKLKRNSWFVWLKIGISSKCLSKDVITSFQ